MAFQTSVNAYLAPGIVGSWASANPHVSLLAPNNGDLAAATNGAWRVGTAGVTVGNFAFADTATGLATSAHPGTGAAFTSSATGPIRIGFVQRDQVALITTYLAGDTLSIAAGLPVTLLSRGDVWAKFAGGASVGNFVFAKYSDGSAVAGATSTSATTTVTADTTNTSANLANVSAAIYPGMPVSGTGIPAGAYIVSYNAVAGTAVLSAAATATNTGTTLTLSTGALTDFRVDSVSLSGEISKISVWG